MTQRYASRQPFQPAKDFSPPPTPHTASSAQYEPGEKVNLWVNKVGPYHNPQETYEYFSLPYCQVTAEY